ncbi:uncharacterized protein BDR25DRAFT_36360 [Lindgomyces ingoldianus]|uniref:Uncharacterized protein n=1 Tax=Lindgomyces ingoldianus TaxID=673940 RepID=A0ACB6QVF8_9PLEO|nr:uncharacterized protein BDR25DRAFT_36360 [Lindgomyces ingoldianus]KAF2470062.1 hypothetical protein BDR25DRAFT_36360 [Lindgomyces ingoldianus]
MSPWLMLPLLSGISHSSFGHCQSLSLLVTSWVLTRSSKLPMVLLSYQRAERQVPDEWFRLLVNAPICYLKSPVHLFDQQSEITSSKKSYFVSFRSLSHIP